MNILKVLKLRLSRNFCHPFNKSSFSLPAIVSFAHPRNNFISKFSQYFLSTAFCPIKHISFNNQPISNS